MENPKLALIPSGYKSGKVYSILPTDGVGDFDYERNGDASRVNKDGLIEELTVDDTPRLDWLNSDCPSLLLEPQRTNLVTQSEDLSTTWLKSAGVTLTSGQISPNGDTSAYKVEMTSGASNYLYIGGGIDGVEYTISGYFKADSETNIGFGDGNLAPNSIDLTTEWKRFSFTFTRSGGGLQIDNYFGVSPSQQAKTFYAWGIQMEAGSYPTSYIKTTGGIETRQKDQCFNGGDSDLFDITEGTFFVDAYAPNSTNSTIISLSNGTDAQKITLLFEAVNSRVRTYSSGGVLYYNNLSYNQRNKILITFKLNEYKTYINGALVGSDTSATVPTGMDRLNFSNRSNTANHFEGKVHDTRVYDRVLTEAEAVELTTI